MKIECFLLYPTNMVRRHLRRYAGWDSVEGKPVQRGGKCEVKGNGGYHQAWAKLPNDNARYDEKGGFLCEHWSSYEGDPRWPTHCLCGYEFQKNDEWQIFTELIYSRADGEKMTIREAPVGAMWDATWFKGVQNYGGPDGLCLVVKTLGGEWVIDGPASGGGNWVRTGAPPKITVRPSIGIGSPFQYHAFLTDGALEDI